MPEHLIEIVPRDPLVFRDARPFSSEPGAFAHSLPFPMPHTVAGAVRSHLVRRETGFAGWNKETSDRAQAIAVTGPLLAKRGTVYAPAPRDAVVFRNETVDDKDPGRYRARWLQPQEPQQTDEPRGCLWPGNGPGLWPLTITDEGKPHTGMAWWSLDTATNWLYSRPAPDADVEILAKDTLEALVVDTRVHVSIDPGKNTAADGALFGTEALVFPNGTALLCKANGQPDEVKEAFGPLGGERRLALFKQAASDAWPAFMPPTAPPRETKRFRIQLVTPAIFNDGWKPGDIGATLNRLTGRDDTWTLKAAACGRPVPVSGWDLATRSHKQLRYAAPAGSVYFLELEKPVDPLPILKALWLQPVCDNAADNANGYGLILPGIW